MMTRAQLVAMLMQYPADAVVHIGVSFVRDSAEDEGYAFGPAVVVEDLEGQNTQDAAPSDAADTNPDVRRELGGSRSPMPAGPEEAGLFDARCSVVQLHRNYGEIRIGDARWSIAWPEEVEAANAFVEHVRSMLRRAAFGKEEEIVTWGGAPHRKATCKTVPQCFACDRLGYHLEPVKPGVMRETVFASGIAKAPSAPAETVLVGADARCGERVWDNGDMTDCGRKLPCELHPVEEVAAKALIEKIRRTLSEGYGPLEKYTDRVRKVASIAENLPPLKGDMDGFIRALYGAANEGKVTQFKTWAKDIEIRPVAASSNLPTTNAARTWLEEHDEDPNIGTENVSPDYVVSDDRGVPALAELMFEMFEAGLAFPSACDRAPTKTAMQIVIRGSEDAGVAEESEEAEEDRS